LIKANIQEQEQRRKDKEAIQDTIEKYRLRIEELRLIENEGKTLLHSYLSNLKHLKFEAYKNNTKDEVLAMHNHQQLTLSKLETRFKELQLRREGAAKKLTTYNEKITVNFTSHYEGSNFGEVQGYGENQTKGRRYHTIEATEKCR